MTTNNNQRGERPKSEQSDPEKTLAPLNCGGGAPGGKWQGSKNTSYSTAPCADWELWASMPKAELWRAVALSLDSEPVDCSDGFQGINLEKAEATFPSDFMRRLKIARAHLARNDNDCQIVGLPEFATFAVSMSWSLPKQFPRVAPNQSEKPIGTRERETLLKLIIGMAIAYYGYDAAVKRSGTVSEIVDDLKKKAGFSITDDTVRKFLNEARETVLDSANHRKS
jgi:hypothetical protein